MKAAFYKPPTPNPTNDSESLSSTTSSSSNEADSISMVPFSQESKVEGNPKPIPIHSSLLSSSQTPSSSTTELPPIHSLSSSSSSSSSIRLLNKPSSLPQLQPTSYSSPATIISSSSSSSSSSTTTANISSPPSNQESDYSSYIPITKGNTVPYESQIIIRITITIPTTSKKNPRFSFDIEYDSHNESIPACANKAISWLKSVTPTIPPSQLDALKQDLNAELTTEVNRTIKGRYQIVNDITL